MMNIGYIFIFLLFATVSFSERVEVLKTGIKQSLAGLTKMIETNQPLNKNPLENYDFDRFKCRSFLYFYRAWGYLHLAKNSHKKKVYLERALADLMQAKLSWYFDDKRIEKLFLDVRKELVEVFHEEKNYSALIDTIEWLPAKERIDSRIIVYYGEALFNTKKIDDFKKLVRNYLVIFGDETQLKKYLKKVPNWASVVSTINVSEPSVKQTTALADTPVFTKEMILSEPTKAFLQLEKNTYFKSAEPVFKIASDIYFSLYKKNILNNHEKKFVNVFRQKMHTFAPAFMDSLIFSFWKIPDLKTAEILSRSFLERYLGHPLYPKVLYNLGRIKEDGKNYQEAAKIFKKFLDQSDEPTYLELARFRLAWTLLLAKREKEAKPYFLDYIANYPEGRYASTCEYFLININKKEPDFLPQQAIDNFIKKYPLNLFSFLLIDEYKLSHNVILPNLSTTNSLKNNLLIEDFKADIKTLNQLAIFRELKELGLFADAGKVLKNISFDANNDLLNLYLASQFQELDDIHGEVSNLIKVASKDFGYRSLVPWKNLFPFYRRELIEKELLLQKSSASPLLILALIRQESTFNNYAQSTANAIGLMQLTEGTAKDAAKRMEVLNYSLFNEEDNLRLGIKTIADLLKKYQRIDYALAAYNAGESATNLWILLRGHLDPLQFIESIPYPETRLYVKSILRNFAIYRMLYETDAKALVSYN